MITGAIIGATCITIGIFIGRNAKEGSTIDKIADKVDEKWDEKVKPTFKELKDDLKDLINKNSKK